MKANLTKWQGEVASDKHRFKIICAGRRAGKSVLARITILKWAIENPGLYWIVSPTYKQSKQIHWNDYLKEIPTNWIVKKNEVELSVQLENGSRIELKGAENPDNLRGVKLRGLVIDEIASIRNWSWLWQEVLRPTLTDYEAPAMFISTPKGFNHFYELYQRGQREGEYKSWTFTSYDNSTIKDSEIDQAQKELTDDAFHQEYLAEFRQYTGLVYKVFDRRKHVRSIDDFQPVYYIRGLDRGFRNPTAVPIIAVNKDDVWYQIDELYQTQLTNPELYDKLKELSKKNGIEQYEYSTMDSAQAGDIQELANLGEDFLPVEKVSKESNTNYVRYKIQRLTERIKSDGYYVHPSCEETIREFEAYRWKEKRDQTKADPDEPEKVNDHCVSGDTIIHTIAGKKKIKNLVGENGQVYTDGNIRPFYNVKLTRKNAPVYEIKTNTGSLVATKDHLIKTPFGWVELQDLTPGCIIRTNDWTRKGTIRHKTRVFGQKILSLWQLLHELSKQWRKTATSSGVGTLQRKGSKEKTHTPQRRRQNKQPDIKPSISDTIRACQQTFDRRTKAKNAQESQGKRHAKSDRVAQVKRSKRIPQKNRKKILAEQKNNSKKLLNMRPGLSDIFSKKIKILFKYLWSESEAWVQEIQSQGTTDVYNMEVEGDHCFTVNDGIIVHNCMDAIGDLNSMYEYYYKPRKKKPWEDKIPGTYIPPSPVDEDTSENSIISEQTDEYWV